MAAFMTRVELHSAKESDYETLHTAMEAEGFSRTITGSDKVVYHLPTAEYYRVAQLTRQQVLDSAKLAADKTKKTYAVVVTESNGVTWTGLAKVK
jgi:hypothetical protein